MDLGRAKTNVKRFTLRTLKLGAKLPILLRVVLGICFLLGGIFFLLPFFGIWMVPLGLALLGLALPWTRRRIQHWMNKTETELEESQLRITSNQ